MTEVNTAFLTSFLIILCGYLFRRAGILKEADSRVLSTVVLKLTFPALIITTVLSLELRLSLLLFPAVSFLFCGGMLLLSGFLFRKKDSPRRGLLMMGSSGFNNGLFAFPIAEAIWGQTGLLYLAMFDIGNALILLGVNYVVAAFFAPSAGSSERTVSMRFILSSLLHSIPLMAYLAGLLLNLLEVNLPLPLTATISALGRANMALVLLLLGMHFEFRFDTDSGKDLLTVLFLRYAIGLAAGFALFLLLPYDLTYRGILMIALILPVGMTIIPYAVEFGYSGKLAGSLANITILISFVLMWLMIAVFNLA